MLTSASGGAVIDQLKSNINSLRRRPSSGQFSFMKSSMQVFVQMASDNRAREDSAKRDGSVRSPRISIADGGKRAFDPRAVAVHEDAVHAALGGIGEEIVRPGRRIDIVRWLQRIEPVLARVADEK